MQYKISFLNKSNAVFSFSIKGGVLSPEAHDFSLDESFDSEDDSDHYDDYSSDAGNDCSSNVSQLLH